MYWNVFGRWSSIAALVVTTAVAQAAAQCASAPEQAQSQSRAAPSEPQPQHDMQHMPMGNDHDMVMPSSREGSGTSWLPDETPMYAIHAQARGWMLMAHGNAFLQYLHESGSRGSDQAGSINWLMGMADRTMGSGH